MKRILPLFFILIALVSLQLANGQYVNNKGFLMSGKNPETIVLNQTITKDSEVIPFDGKGSTIFGLAVKASITFSSEKSLVRIVLVDKQGNEYLVYEAYPLIEESNSFSVDNLCEETAILNAVKPQSLRIELKDASIALNSIVFSKAVDQGVNFAKLSKDNKNLQNNQKIDQINKSIKAKGLAWFAGETGVSALSFAEKKKLYGQSTFPAGIEYYVGGVLSTGDGLTLKSATTSTMVDKWDWRNRHGKNWITEVKNQGSCGSCWAFAVTGATEAQVNLFYNQSLNMNLSEQNLLSCSGAGSCSGGYPGIALDYEKNIGIIDEGAFPYAGADVSCNNKSSNSTEQIKIAGRVDFGSSVYPVSEDNLKKMIIKYGPVSGGILDWSHAMTLVGWQVVKEGDRFYYRDTNRFTYTYTVPAGSALIGKTVWKFKNSYGSAWGDAGYVYVETSITNFAWTHALVAPVQSLKQNYTVQCVDNDHDGYYWWGLGLKPAGAPACPDTPDGNDADPTLGPLDDNGNCIPLNSAPVTDFTSIVTSLTANGSVNFTDLSTNAPTSWSWSFPGGTPSTSAAKNPVVSYMNAGNYDVTLVATNSSGSNTKVKFNFITVNPYVAPVPAPVADFKSNITILTENGSVNFTDLSANAPTSWSWSFPGGTPSTSTSQNPVVSYANAGTYDVTLVATNNSGSTTKVKLNDITVNPYVAPVPAPVADFKSNITILTENGSVNFTDLSANAPTSWSWSFPGGTPSSSTSQNPVVSYANAGTYDVTLVAANNSGSTTKVKLNDITVNPYVSPVPSPVADFTSNETILTANGSVNFIDLSINAPAEWAWTFDGGIPASSTSKNPVVAYKNPGKYNVTLVASNSNGKSTKIKTGYITVNEVVSSTYCSSNGNAGNEWISQVTIDKTSFNSKSSGSTGSADLTANVFNVDVNSTYSVKLTPGYLGRSTFWNWSIWIDFNHDMDFEDEGEQLLASGKSKTTIKSSVYIPSGALIGSTRMRVSMKQGSLPLPCEIFSYGEVKDYSINISAPQTALIPRSAQKDESTITSNLSLTLFPNPAESMINLKLNELYGNENYAIYNMQGSVVKNRQIDSNVTRIDVTGFPAGIYLVNVKSGGQNFQEKFIKR